MNIGIDGNEANVKNKVGVSIYTLELLKYFNAKANHKLQFIIYLKTDPSMQIHNDPGSSMPRENNFFRYEVIKSPGFWRDIFLPLKLYTGVKPDVFFSPAHYTPRFCPVPIVVTIHDVAYEYYPNEFLQKDLYKLKNWTAHALRQSIKVIAVSQNTKKDLVKFYNLPEDKIKVISNGFSNNESGIRNKESGIFTKYQIQNTKYLLYVGTLQPRKNLETLIEAFALFVKEKPDYKLVIAGKKGWLYENIFIKVKDLELENYVIFTGYVTGDELATLYQNAVCFVLPSLYEGFGIPIIEAMSYGCPVIAANASSLPEIGGSACLYFDPHDRIDIRNKIKMVVEDRELRIDLIKKGKERVKKFSWEKCGKETLEILTTVSSST